MRYIINLTIFVVVDERTHRGNSILNDMKKITIRDIAKEAGVSVGLASMVLNGKSGVSAKNMEKVRAVMKRLNYQPNKAASVLRSGTRKTIGVITPDLSNHYFSEVSRHIENVAYKEGYTVLFGSSDERRDKISSLIDTFHSDGIQGILITPAQDSRPEIEKALSLGMKIVMMNRQIDDINDVGCVTLDNVKATDMAMEHLIANGYRNIELVTNDNSLSTLVERIQAYKNYMADKGLEAIVSIVDENNTEDLKNLLEEAKKRGTDAFLIPRGYLALYLCKAIHDNDYSIPEDFAVLGFDGGLNYRIMTPTVSQIIQSPQETAEESYRMLIEMMQNNIPGSRIFLQPSLEIGESTKVKL